MKAVVLAGGVGTRLRPLTYSMPKQLIPVGGRPVLSHVLRNIAECGITEVVVITSPESHGHISTFLGSTDQSLQHTLIVQEQPRGLADAFRLALPHLGGESSLMYLGDCLLTGGVRHVIDEHLRSGASATVLVKEVDDPSRYGIVELGHDGRVSRLVEKPLVPATNLAIVGVYVFGPSITESVEAIRPSSRGEYEITDAIQHLVDQGGEVRPSFLSGWWMDTGTVGDVLAAHELLMANMGRDIQGQLDNCDISGPVAVEEGAIVSGSSLTGPVIIGRNAVVSNSRIGPFVDIQRGVSVKKSEIMRSIVMTDVEASSVKLRRSIVGPGSRISSSEDHGWSELVVGADSFVDWASQSG